MAQVAVVTDSVACLPSDLAQSLNINIVPVYIHYRGKSYRDGIDIAPEEVYRWLLQADKFPTTSAPSPADFLETFKKLTDKSILCITVASKVSAVFDSARLAKEAAAGLLNKKDIEVVDSGTGCMGEGFLVLRAAEAARMEKDLSVVLSRVKRLLPRVKVIGMLNTLHYLVKGGRVPKVVGWVTDLLQIKPILGINNGGVKLIARVRTTEKALKKMLAIVEKAEGENMHLAIHYTDDPSFAYHLKEEIEGKFKPTEIYLTPLSPAMGVHTGPGLVGLSFYKD